MYMYIQMINSIIYTNVHISDSVGIVADLFPAQDVVLIPFVFTGKVKCHLIQLLVYTQ